MVEIGKLKYSMKDSIQYNFLLSLWEGLHQQIPVLYTYQLSLAPHQSTTVQKRAKITQTSILALKKMKFTSEPQTVLLILIYLNRS